ncbi:MAG TPA: YlxR family protein [Rhodoglobus sp.]|nr:YlxR family protein [Rhodoglobus sp.]HOY82256.1 YlxR family protein [Rhodoglobus sp.]HPG76585.1 YlxR family protein [Rhodoglobus sp.]HQA24198.1 YlxR family protein [Rhodoglobus sp.]
MPGSTSSPTRYLRTSTAPRGFRLVPVRTCIGCRVRAEASLLLRVVARDGEVVPDPSATLPGRGAWVHPTAHCVEISAKRRAFGRALRVSSALDASQVLALVHSQPGTEEQAD